MYLVLMGPPGSGKGTQAKKLAKACNLEHISTGDLLRNNSNLTKEQRAIIDGGDFIPDGMMLEIVKTKLDSLKDGWILDGYPRTIAQAKHLYDAMHGVPMRVVYFQVNEKELLDRLTGRLTCSDCGAIFHKITKPPTTAGICDECGGKLIQRKDDTKETVQNRLQTYHNFTEPVIKYFKDHGKIETIETGNDKSIDHVFEEVKEILNVTN